MLGISPQIPPLRFMTPLHQLPDFAASEIALNYGLNYGTISAPMGVAGDLNFQIGSAGTIAGDGGSLFSAGGFEQWRLQQAQQFPFLGGLDPSLGLFGSNVESSSYVGGGVSHATAAKASSSGVTHDQLAAASVKMEESQEMSLSRQFLGMPGSDPYWSGSTTAWTDLSGFSSSSTTRNPGL